jgi:hypothetical protein
MNLTDNLTGLWLSKEMIEDVMAWPTMNGIMACSGSFNLNYSGVNKVNKPLDKLTIPSIRDKYGLEILHLQEDGTIYVQGNIKHSDILNLSAEIGLYKQQNAKDVWVDGKNMGGKVRPLVGDYIKWDGQSYIVDNVINLYNEQGGVFIVLESMTGKVVYSWVGP